MEINRKEIGTRIAVLRHQMGLTQDTFAEQLNITRNYLAKLECGIKKPSIELLLDISVSTGRSIDYLVTGNNVTLSEIRIEFHRLSESLSWLK